MALSFTVIFANFAEAMAEGRGKAPGGKPAQIPAGYTGQKADSTEAWR